MTRIVLVEDEKHAREALKKMLLLIIEDCFIIGEFATIAESKEFLENNKVDLVFLDIELQDGTSFELLKQLKSIDFNIIFVTAFNQYAIEAFKFSALDYLLKPIDPSDLEIAVQKALQHIHQAQEYRELLKVFHENEVHYEKRIAVKTANQTHILSLNDIIHLKAEGAYTIIYTMHQKIMTSKNLKYFQSILQKYHFIRAHQSHLINTKRVKKILKTGLQMENDEEVPVATRKRGEVIEYIQRHLQ